MIRVQYFESVSDWERLIKMVERLNILVAAADQPAPKAAGLLAGPLGLLLTNRFEEVTVESLEVKVKADEANRSARIVRA